MFLEDLIERKQRGFLIIEEPEAHLFPKYQKELFYKIISVINQTGSKVFISTHSPYLLMAMNNLLTAKEEGYEKLKDRFVDAKKDINVAQLKDGKSESILDDDGMINGDYIEKTGIMDEFDEILESKK